MSKPKILEQIDNAGGVFVATKGTTTYQEIKNAYDGGKDVIVPWGGAIYELITIPTGSNDLVFHKRAFDNKKYANTHYSVIQLTTKNAWEENPSNFSNGNVDGPIWYQGPTFISSSGGYYRPINISTAEPTASDGNIGDIWIQYEE